MDKSDLTQKIEDWCTEKVQSLEIIEDTKHLCYAIVTSTRKMFVKVFHNNQETARNEFQLLSFLTTILLKYPTNTGYLWIPENLTYLTLDEFHSAIINRFITGITTKKILLENNIHALEICTVMMLAIARIHHTISTHTDDLNIDKKATTFGHWSDCKIRLKSLIRTEAEYILLDNDTDIINDFLYYYWEILFKSASGFPCDYYKDANPANWILTPASNLYAVDFESQRMLPCFVDLINITEFAKDYLTKDEKRSLLSTYLKERIRLDNHWSYIVKNFDIDLLLSLFAIYRHQEQLTHRVRDLKKNSSATWHIQAYFFHLDKLQIHIDQLEKSVRMPYKIIDSLNKIVYIYRQRFTDVFFAGE